MIKIKLICKWKLPYKQRKTIPCIAEYPLIRKFKDRNLTLTTVILDSINNY